MAAESKPTILLVPGAWQPSDAFDPLRQLLAQRGYESVAVDHPSVGGEPADQTLDTDVASLRSTLTRLIDNEAKEVVVLLHSYGTLHLLHAYSLARSLITNSQAASLAPALARASAPSSVPARERRAVSWR